MFARNMPGIDVAEFDAMELPDIEAYIQLLIRELDAQRKALESGK